MMGLFYPLFLMALSLGTSPDFPILQSTELVLSSKIKFYSEATLPFVYFREAQVIPYSKVEGIRDEDWVCSFGANDLKMKKVGIPAFDVQGEPIRYQVYDRDEAEFEVTRGISLYFSASEDLGKPEKGYFVGCQYPKDSQHPALLRSDVEKILGPRVRWIYPESAPTQR